MTVLAGLGLGAALLLTPDAQAQSRDSGSDFTLDAANGYPTGIWSDGTTMWVADFEDAKLYAYRMSDRSRDSGKDFTLDADNGSPVGIWSDGTTMWASDFTDGKLYAYRMSDRSRDSGKDFNTLFAAGNKFPEGIWSDGTTMWVADTGNDTVFAYDLSTRAWDFEKDITLGPGHNSPMGVWSNGSTMWVSDWRDTKLYAYRMSDQTRDSGKDFALDADDESYEGIWSAGSTMWVASRDDAKLYAYDWNNPATGAPTITGAVRVDETLAAGARSIADADGLEAAIFEYQWVSSDGSADTDIAGATDSTYTIVPGDRGRTIKVRVSFTDGAGNRESMTSEPTGRVGAPGICDRTPAVMAAIVAGMNEVAECSEASETRLRTWTGSQRFGPDITPGLYLQGKGLSALQAGDFGDLHALRALDLNRNFLETVPDGLFQDLRAVEELYLSGNFIDELPDGTFAGQTANLSVLDLSANRLERLSDGVLGNLDALVSLSLTGNGLSDLPAGLFDDLARLEVLDLSANSINELPDGVFGGLGNLQRLSLAGNELKDLPDGVFEGLPGLTALDAGDNPGAPFTFTAELERRGDDAVVVRIAEGTTPFDLQIELSALNGDLSTETVTIAAGDSYSDVVEVRAHGHLPVTIEIDSADFLLPSGGSASGIRADRGSAMLMWIGRPLVQREWIQDGPFALHPENADPKSIWSDGETLWVGDESARKVFAYKLWDDPGTEASEYGTRDPGWDLPSLGDEDFYVTGHGPRLYVAEESLDGASRDVFGYDLTSFTRAEDRDFVYGGLNVAGGVMIVRGMATDGRHLWITNTTSHAHAFRLFDDPETPEDEYGRPDASRKLTMPGRGQLKGLFTDGRTMWGVRFASNDASARSVKLSDGTEAGYDFTLHEDNDHAYGIWSDGETFYVVDADDAMIYTYHGVGGVVRPFVADAETAAALVGNTGQSGDAGHDLGSTGDKRAQAFTTGTSRAGYALASVGIEFGEVSDTSSAPSDLEVTLNADGGGVPGGALCTLVAPASLSERSVNTLAAPASGTTCPALVKEKTYFVVVERVRVTGSGAIAVSGTASGSEDTGAAEGWSIADGSAAYSSQAAAQGWASDAFSYKIEVRGSFINNPAAGEATVTGTAQVDETLTADTSGISDDDGLSNVSYSYLWIAGGLDIAGATGSSYTLTSNEQGKRIKVRVAFVDDRGNYETLTSEATPSVKAADRPGTVSLFPARPRAGTVVSARLSDPDGLEGGGSGPAASLGAVSWSWARSPDGNVWTRIEAYDDGDSYVPTEEDEGMLLRAEASYTDGRGPGKSAQAASSARVGAREPGPELTVTEIVTGLSHPWGIDFTPDGTMLFTQRAGVLNARLTDGAVKQVAADLSDLLVDGFAGLQALAVDPDFATNRRFYTLQGHAGREMQVIVWTIDADYDEATRVVDPLVEGIPVGPGPWHSGGRLLFGPEGYLWIATGDGRSATAAQDLTSLGGKVLRVDPRTGAGAPGNPFGASSPVYAYGFRNPQGLALRPGTGQMWLVEHGPKHDDEINLLAPGGNYGWDPVPDDGALVFYDYSDEAGVPMTDLAKFPSARQARWSSGFPTLATSGAVFLDGSQWGEWEGRLAVATLKTKALRVFEFTEQGDFVSQIVVPELDGSQGRLRTPALGPDGALYIATSNKPGVDRILRVAANRAATGAPGVNGAVQVGGTLTADVSGIADPDGLDDDAFRFQWVRSHHGSSSSDIEGATASTYTLVMADLGKTISVRVSFYDDWGTQETLASPRTVKVSVVACTAGEQAPAATAVEIEAVPAIVESTTGEYFVLYVRPDLDSEREFPVSVTLGEDGATTLTEQLSPLPKEHYRVEKFLIADPADIDNDCIDDITELGDPVRMNPLNPARAVPFHDGAVAIPDRETFEALSYKGRDVPYHPRLQDLEFVKFYIIGVATDNMGIYFMNTETHRIHPDFGDAIGLWEDPLWGQGNMGGEIIYHPNVVAPDGSLGVYLYQFQPMDAYTFGHVARSYEVLAASMPLLDDNLAYYPMPRRALPLYHRERALYDDSRINVVLREDILPDVPFLPLNVGEGYGFLRLMSLEERPDPRDVAIYETIPNELSRVAGLITTVPQTPLSHVNLRAVQDGVPNAFIRDALDAGDIDDLIGRYVHYSVTADGYSIRAATPAEVEAHYADSRPSEPQTPERDLTVTEITPLSDIEFDDWNAFGVKAANVAVLRTLGFPDGTAPDGFAAPFYFYDEFMKHNGFYDDIEEMLEDPDFQSDYDTQEKELKKLRKKIKKGETPEWIIAALTEMHSKYPEGQSLRYRSSTNNEDLPGFSGAGLYDSKTQHPDETEEDGIAKSLKQVYASLWNFRAFTEREFYRVDHLAAAMGVLVHPNYSDELANGVAVSFDPIRMRYGSYYVNSQLGEDLVTNPDAHSAPEEILLHQGGEYTVLATSNQMQRGQLLMSDAQMDQLRRHLEVIHDEFADLYGIEGDEPFAMEIEFKITSDDILSIKQARPWVFGDDTPSENTPATGAPTISGTPQVDQTLTADTSGIADEDGLDNVSYTYQWIAGGSDIDGATGSTYTLTYGEQGEAIQVRVSFTDDRNNSETRTSEATEAVAAAPNREATGAPTISGTPQVDQTLTADTSGIADEDGLDNVSYSYQWIAGGSDIDGATGSTYTLTASEQGQTIQVKVSFTDDRDNPETLTSAATGVVAAKPNTPATGVPTIGGTAQVGETLTALTNGITDADGLTNPTYSHQWIRSDNGTDANITGQTDSTYTLVAADVGKTIKVRVSFTDDAENEESLTSAATAAVTAKANNPATGAPTISGTAQVDQTLTAGTSDIADSDGLTNVSYSYQWIRSDGGTDTDIVGETDSTYTLVSTDQGKTIKVKVTFTDDADNQESLTSAATATVVAKPNTAPTGLPTISGTARVDETLTADTSDIADDDGLTDPTFTYQWVAGGADISGATSYTYFLTSSEQGQTIQVQVSFTDDADNQERLTSVATAAIAPLSYSTVWSADMLVVEYTETSIGAASADLFSNIVGSRDPKIKSLWSHVPSRDIRLAFQEGISDADDLTLIVGELKLEFPPGSSGNSSFKWTDVDVDWEDGQTIQVRIVQTSALEEPEKQEEPADNTPATGAPTISGTAQVDETLAAETSNIADDDGLTNVSYSYQWTRSDGSTYADIAGETDSTYTLVFADQGKTIKVRVSFTDDADNAESLTSVPTVAVAAAPNREATGQPTISGTPQVGETLTADTSAIADEDGLTNVSYRYQWIWNDNGADTDMAGETSTTYTLVTADAGKTIKVRVSFSDDADNQESLTSVATDTVAAKPNSRATGAPTINGTAQVGETLTVLTNGITDEDGLTNVSYSYHWIRSDNGTDADIAGQTDSTYTLVSADQGKAIKVKVSFTDDADHEETLTSAATAAVAARPNSPATGAPAISGTAQAGETLTADTSGIADADGLTNVSFSYQWIRNDGTTDTDIQGATSSTYTLSDADEGKTIKVRVSFTDRGGYQETLTSATTIIVDQPGTVSLWPELPRVGTVVSATLTDPDGLEGAGSGAAASLGAVSWQWARSSEGSTWTSVDVYEDGDSYTPAEDDEGMWLKVTAVYTDGHGKGKSAEAITAATVGAREASPELTVTALVTGLTHPWDIAFTPDGTMLFTERDDGLRVRLTDGTVRQVTADFSDLNFGGTAGLLALVLDPDFVSNRRFYTYQRHTGAEMQVIAWTIDQDYIAATRVADPLVGGIPVNLRHLGPSHGGGRLRFGPQGYLWVATGDGYSGTAAQDLSSLGGKVLRVDSQTGAGAPDNPFAPSPVYTYGHRNPQGLALRPGAGQMWSVEHGPDHDDEINLLVSGGNYGWDPAPDEGAEDLYDEITTPMTDLVKFPDALEAKWSSGHPTLAVGGGVFLEGSQWREWEGRFAVATLKTKSVRVFKFTEEGDLVSQVVVPELDRTYGRLRTAVLGPDGALYITTTNGGGKDKILKVVPANTPATGLPTISGTAQVGETLTALTNGITDADGLTNVSYSYQWLAANVGIAGATNSTYTLSDEDEGKSIKVRVSFTDDADNAETRTSEATDTVAATKPGVPGHLNVFPHGTGALDVYWEAPASDGGSAITGYKVQWKESADRWETPADVSEATVTGTTHTITGLTGGVEYTVRVSAVNDAGEGSPSAEAYGTPQEAQIWSANLTVGIVAETFAGYTTFLPDSSVLGALSSDTITLDDASYAVKALGVLNGKLILSVMPKLTAGFVLVVGTEEFASTDASTLEGDSIIQFQWNDPGLDLPEGEEVAVRVTEPAENTPATGEPTITGTTQVGETLTADTSEIQDSNGRINVIFEYQWMVTDTEIDDATESTYTPSASDAGKTISVRVNFRDDAGYKESVTSQATEVVAATVPSAPQRMTVTSGSQTQELDVSWQAPSSNGGSAVTGYRVQWKESTDIWDTADDVSEATETGTTHTISGLTGGVEYAVRVMASNDVGDGPASTEVKGTPAGGVPEQTVEPENSAPTGLPSISGTPQVDQTLTADTSNIDDEDGLANVSYRYQWGAGGSDIDGATGSTYTLTYSEQGQTIQVQVFFTDDADNAETLTSAATVAVAAAPNRGATGQPSISGTPQVGQTLTADTSNISDLDGITNPTFAYQWRSGGLTIIGATGSTYTLTAGDQGKTITVRVRFTDDRNNIESRISNATAAVAAKPNTAPAGLPTISGTPQVGETLTADTSAIADDDGLTGVSYSYQWIANDGTTDTDIAGQTDSAYTLTDDDAGKAIRVRVSFTDDADNQEFLTSADTDTVAATKPGVPGRLNIFPHDAEALDVYWEAPASDGGSDITGYKVQWKDSADSWDTLADVSEATASGTIHTITGLTDGVEYSVRVLATNGVGDSPPSVEQTGTPRETKAPEMVRPRVDGATLKVLYDEALDQGSAPPTDSFDVRVACTCDDMTWLDEESKRAVESVSVDGGTVVLTLVSAATSEDVVVVSYTPPSDAATARTRDLAGNAAAGFNSTEVFNDTDEPAESEENGEPEETTEGETPLTVSLEATTESHDGSSEFTFEIEFSEEVGLSYKTLRDFAFTVSGGEVRKAQRMDKPSNVRWLITVEPNGNGDVTIELPATTDCAAAGAICTGDGRMLTNSLSFTVSGPGQ